MGQVFLSYSREDVAAARAFADALEGAGHEVWWDRHVRAGSRYSREIAAALKNAEAVIVLWSKASIESAWVQDEAAEGLEGDRIVPAVLDGCKPPLGFRQYQTIDMVGWNGGGAAFTSLLAAVEAKLGGTGQSPPRTAKPPAVTPAQPTICVVPFANLSSDPEQDYFSDGITEDVITDLSKVSALGVVGRNTTFALKGEKVDVQRLAAELGVTHVLDGTVRKAGSSLRITAQLTEASSGRSLWAERYDRALSDVFAIQDEISHAIVDALQVSLLPKEKSAINQRSTSSAQAYDLYLRARSCWSECEAGDARRNDTVVRLCGEAIALDPEYASAWALLALATAELRFWSNRAADALAPAERAIALDPRLPEPHCVRARMFEERSEYDAAEAAARVALGLDAHSWEANREAGQLLYRKGAVRESVPFFEKAIAVASKDHHSAAMLIFCHIAGGDAQGARDAAEIAVYRAEGAIICDPANGSAFASGASGLAALGEPQRARRWIRKALNVDPGNLAMRYALAATLACQLSDQEAALDVLDPVTETLTAAPHLRMLELDPCWGSLRGRPRFEAMIKRSRKRLEVRAGSSITC